MHAADGHISRPPCHSNPYIKSESYVSVLKLYCTFPHIIIIYCTIFIKSPPTMWWWRLIVFAESAHRRRRHLFLLSLVNPYSDYFQIFAVCILALGNLSGNFFWCFSVSSTKSKMAAKILWRTLELEPLHRFVSWLV